MKGFILITLITGLVLAVLFGCATRPEMTSEQKKDLKTFQRVPEEERVKIAAKHGAEDDLKQWEDQINRQQIAKGMSKAAVLMAWGSPNHTEPSKDGSTEKWFYRRSYDRGYTLLFRGDTLESWQTRKYDRSR